MLEIPNKVNAVVDRAKIQDYLLSREHPDGRSKARFFQSLGFAAQRWEVLAAALKQHLLDNEAQHCQTTPFGMKWIVEGPISTPKGSEPLVRSIWFTATDAGEPRLVTVYPIRGQ